ncbi:MAG: hypothetical protein EpisKO_04450 [Epibacterium sp.]
MTRGAKLWAAAVIMAALASCGSLSKQLVRGVLPGGGPNVAANVQAGRSNAQVVGGTSTQNDLRLVRPQSRSIEQSTGETGVRAEAVQSITVRNEAPPWVWLLVLFFTAAAVWAVSDEIRDCLARNRKGPANAD